MLFSHVNGKCQVKGNSMRIIDDINVKWISIVLVGVLCIVCGCSDRVASQAVDLEQGKLAELCNSKDLT